MDFRWQVWKRVWKMKYFGLKLGQDLENRAAHPYQKFRGVPPPPGGGGGVCKTFVTSRGNLSVTMSCTMACLYGNLRTCLGVEKWRTLLGLGLHVVSFMQQNLKIYVVGTTDSPPPPPRRFFCLLQRQSHAFAMGLSRVTLAHVSTSLVCRRTRSLISDSN